jgi:GT2 family glycosyltransferase
MTSPNDQESRSAGSDNPREGFEISVVVLSKDEPELEQTLGLLEPQCRSLGAECIVVDRSHGRLDEIRVRNPFVRWIDYIGPLGVRRTLAHQRNVGVRAASGQIIVFADAGGAPAQDWLAEVTAPIREGRAVAVAGPVYPLGPSPYTGTNHLEEGARIFRVITANAAFRRQVFDTIGGFDERFAYGEDVDFGWRAEDHGLGFVCASRARMGLDFGDATRNLRRARWYGAATARLMSKHPKRIRELLRVSPDVFVYPVWELGVVVALILVPWHWWIPLAWLALLLIPLARGARQPHSILRMRIHLIDGLWAYVGWFSIVVPRAAPIAFIPRDRANRYQAIVSESLSRVGVAVAYLDNGPTRNHSLNVLLGPVRLVWRRLRGVKIVHVHCLDPFALPSTRRIPLLRRAPRLLFGMWLCTARMAGLRIIYTAHDLAQHRATFDDDDKAQRMLLRRTDAVICASNADREDLLATFSSVVPPDVTVIAEGPPGGVDRSDRREVRHPSTGEETAHAWAQTQTWHEIGAATRDVYERVLHEA